LTVERKRKEGFNTEITENAEYAELALFKLVDDGLASAENLVPEWELLVHTRQFSKWQRQDLRDTELGRVLNRLKKKNEI